MSVKFDDGSWPVLPTVKRGYCSKLQTKNNPETLTNANGPGCRQASPGPLKGHYVNILPDPVAEGEGLRVVAHARLKKWRPVITRRLQRAYVNHLLNSGPDTSDATRALVPIPQGIDPRVTGAAIRELSADCIIRSAVCAKSRRAIAHARWVVLWEIADRPAAEKWLASHPELPAPSSDPSDPSDPFAP